jgi:hypothetical protein
VGRHGTTCRLWVALSQIFRPTPRSMSRCMSALGCPGAIPRGGRRYPVPAARDTHRRSDCGALRPGSRRSRSPDSAGRARSVRSARAQLVSTARPSAGFDLRPHRYRRRSRKSSDVAPSMVLTPSNATSPTLTSRTRTKPAPNANYSTPCPGSAEGSPSRFSKFGARQRGGALIAFRRERFGARQAGGAPCQLWAQLWALAQINRDKFLICLVGAARFELATPCSRSKCATRLRYAPPDHPTPLAGEPVDRGYIAAPTPSGKRRASRIAGRPAVRRAARH